MQAVIQGRFLEVQDRTAGGRSVGCRGERHPSVVARQGVAGLGVDVGIVAGVIRLAVTVAHGFAKRHPAPVPDSRALGKPMPMPLVQEPRSGLCDTVVPEERLREAPGLLELLGGRVDRGYPAFSTRDEAPPRRMLVAFSNYSHRKGNHKGSRNRSRKYG